MDANGARSTTAAAPHVAPRPASAQRRRVVVSRLFECGQLPASA